MFNLAALRFAVLLPLFVVGAADAAPQPLLTPPPEDFVRRVRETVPADWTVTIEASSIVARPSRPPEFVNLVGGMLQRNTESREAYLDRHRVKFDYQIALRISSRLTSEQFEQLVRADQTARRRIEELERHPFARPGKGSVSFPETPEGLALDQEYDQLRASLRPLPSGYFGSVTVTIEPTQTRYAMFRHEKDQEQCRQVIESLQQLLTPYAATGNKPSP
ncbi:MAG: hypothetical protein JNK76_15130 [Planctomycetales bacterium]|nr:hypothetical protein [Planctomycetales bacterium]MBN8624632.1 hypothetical protein [Planctomycetota bacterium]